MDNLKEIKKENLETISAGGLAGALGGAIIGGTVGLAGATIGGVKSGKLSGNSLWKGYTSCAIAGAGIGFASPTI